MKMMFHILATQSKGFEKLLAQEAAKKEPVFIKELLARFTTDIIGSVAFGIDCHCMIEPDNEFRIQSQKAFGIRQRYKQLMRMYFSNKMLTLFSYKQTDEDVDRFFSNLVRSTIEYREKNGIYRKDFLQMLIELKNTGKYLTLVSQENDNKLKIMRQFFANLLLGNRHETPQDSSDYCRLETSLRNKLEHYVRIYSYYSLIF
uniref:Cytochrome P450 6a2-like n=1 Tax=Diabrotica virgifera virgifera TaxID=50390 RepID=A0A6P7GEW1_DIAVI